jgi:hypothetical protein
MTDETTEAAKAQYGIVIQRDRWPTDTWAVMFKANGHAFRIGSYCSTLKAAQDLRRDFVNAIRAIQIMAAMSGVPRKTKGSAAWMTRNCSKAARFAEDCL